jgi:adenylate cyclase
MEGACRRLLAEGVPVDRAEAFVRTLHPNVSGRSFVWHSDRPVAVVEHTFAFVQKSDFERSAVGQVCRTGAAIRHRATAGAPPDLHLRDEPDVASITDYFAIPITFVSGEVHAITMATRRPGGFTDADLTAFEAIAHPMARLGEIIALHRTAANLLDTYVGRSAGEKILAGHIQLGDTETIEAVIWFSDLRGFTQLAGETPPGDLIRTLNELFECQVPAIERGGGEVLKFIGDGLLAIFPIREGGPCSADRCRAALRASEEALVALEAVNGRRAASGRAPIAFGLALHVGEVAYGNIGGASRLDFTCIGPAVNLAARLEGLTGRLGRAVVTSDAFAAQVGDAVAPIGEHELKGVAGRQRVHAPL